MDNILFDCWPAITAWRLVYLLVYMENKSRFHSTAGTKWITVWMFYLNKKNCLGLMPPSWVFVTRQRWNWINIIYGRWGTSECSTEKYDLSWCHLCRHSWHWMWSKMQSLAPPVTTQLASMITLFGIVPGTFLRWFHVQHIPLPDGYIHGNPGIVHVYTGTL